MKPTRRTVILGVLSALAVAWWVKMVVGTIELASHQGVTWDTNLFAAHDHVPVVTAAVELSIILVASLIPLTAALKDQSLPPWLGWLWGPCILYVLFMCINSFVRAPFGLVGCARGTVRLLGWLAIAALFIRNRKTAR